MEDHYFDEGVVKDTLNFMIIISLLGNKCHLLNAPVEIVRYIEHSDPCEVHE